MPIPASIRGCADMEPLDYAMSAATSALKLQAANDFVKHVIREFKNGDNVYVSEDHPNTLVYEGAAHNREPYVYFMNPETYRKAFPDKKGAGGHASKNAIYVTVKPEFLNWKRDIKPGKKPLAESKASIAHALSISSSLREILIHEYIHILDHRSGKIHNVKPVLKQDKINEQYLKSGWEIEAYSQTEFDVFFKFIQNTFIVFDTWKETRTNLFKRNEKIRSFLNGSKTWAAQQNEKLNRSLLRRLYALWPYAVYRAIKNKLEPMLLDKTMFDDPEKFRRDMMADKELQTLMKTVNLGRVILDKHSISKLQDSARNGVNMVLRHISIAEKDNGKHPYYTVKVKSGPWNFKIELHPVNYNRVFRNPATKDLEIHFDKPEGDVRDDREFVIEQIKTPGSVLNTEMIKAFA